MRLRIKSDWTYNQIIRHVKQLKRQYNLIALSFSIYEIKDKIEFIRDTRDTIYALNLMEWQKDRIWTYMNDYCEFDCFTNPR